MAILFDEYGNPITSSNPLPVQVTGSNAGGESDLTGTGSGTLTLTSDRALRGFLQ